MIELILSVCMVGDPNVCKDIHLTYSAANLTPYQCLMRGQPEIAKWNEGNPNWQVQKYRCGRVRIAERDA